MERHRHGPGSRSGLGPRSARRAHAVEPVSARARPTTPGPSPSSRSRFHLSLTMERRCHRRIAVPILAPGEARHETVFRRAWRPHPGDDLEGLRRVVVPTRRRPLRWPPRPPRPWSARRARRPNLRSHRLSSGHPSAPLSTATSTTVSSRRRRPRSRRERAVARAQHGADLSGPAGLEEPDDLEHSALLADHMPGPAAHHLVGDLS